MFDKEETFALCLKAVNMGMSLRQNQLSGDASNKSGNQILEEWYTIVCNRKKSGLDIL